MMTGIEVSLFLAIAVYLNVHYFTPNIPVQLTIPTGIKPLAPSHKHVMMGIFLISFWD